MPSIASRRRRLIALLSALPYLALPALVKPAQAATTLPLNGEKPRRAPGFWLPLWSASGPVGRDLSLDRLVDRWVYLDFWASWCAPCKLSFPWMEGLHSVGEPKGLTIVAIGVDRRVRNLELFLQQQKPSFTVVWDASMDSPKSYDVQAMPSSYLISPSAEIVSTHRGFKSSEADALKQQILGHL